MAKARLEQADYAALAEFRYLVRCFLEFSEIEAKRVGLTARQHQALLAIKGFGAGEPVSVGTLAERLRIRHHSAVELADRLVGAELITRSQDADDQRRVLIALTPLAEEQLAALSAAHLDELSRLEPLLKRTLDREKG